MTGAVDSSTRVRIAVSSESVVLPQRRRGNPPVRNFAGSRPEGRRARQLLRQFICRRHLFQLAVPSTARTWIVLVHCERHRQSNSDLCVDRLISSAGTQFLLARQDDGPARKLASAWAHSKTKKARRCRRARAIYCSSITRPRRSVALSRPAHLQPSAQKSPWPFRSRSPPILRCRTWLASSRRLRPSAMQL